MERIRMIVRAWRGVLAVFLLAVAWGWSSGIAGAASHRYGSANEKWTRGFRLEPGVTYTYELRSGDGNRAYSRLDRRGTLNLWVPPGGKNEIRFWYTVDGKQRSGVAPNDLHGLVGAVLLAALTGPDPLPADALRLLAAPFQWAHWAALFFESDFRNGVVWDVYQNPPVRFTASRQGNGTYSGEVTAGREVLLELRIDLARPLPARVTSRFGRDLYAAELAVESPGRLLR